jgi:hypothetical protein
LAQGGVVFLSGWESTELQKPHIASALDQGLETVGFGDILDVWFSYSERGFKGVLVCFMILVVSFAGDGLSSYQSWCYEPMQMLDNVSRRIHDL